MNSIASYLPIQLGCERLAGAPGQDNNTPMLAISGQSIAALVMVAVAAGYLAWLAWRALRGINSGAGCCGTSCSPSARRLVEPDGGEAGRPFVPLENLADLARRHKEEREQPRNPV